MPKSQRRATRNAAKETGRATHRRIPNRAFTGRFLVFLPLGILLVAGFLLIASAGADPLEDHPLRPVNTSGPKATLRTFLGNADNAYKTFRRSGYRTREALKFVRRAAGTMDLSQVPPTMREDVGFESTLRLKEVLDNIDIPPLDSIPDPEDFKETDDLFWRIPHTDITIARITDGPRRGAWLFTAATVSQIGNYYKLVRELGGADATFDSTYEKYIYAPGWMIPAGLINSFPRWMRAGVFEQAVWQWVSLLLAVLFSTLVLAWSYRAWQWLLKRMDSDFRRWRLERVAYPVFGMLFLHALLLFIDHQVNITGNVLTITTIGLRIVILLFASWAVLAGGEIFTEGINSVRHIRSTSIAADVIRLLTRVVAFVIVFILFYNAAEQFGIPVGAVFASAGIAGFAVAMAAKDTLSNFFGGVTIFMDRPFKTGDYIVLENDERGEVMQIGLRSTRILTRDDVMIIIPNSIITNTRIVNQSSPQPSFRVHIKIGVAYGSDIRRVESILLEQVIASPLAASHPEPRVRFRAFGDSSLDFELLCWARRPHDRGRLTHELNSGIYNAFNGAGIVIPFPQREVHLRRRSTPTA